MRLTLFIGLAVLGIQAASAQAPVAPVSTEVANRTLNPFFTGEASPCTRLPEGDRNNVRNYLSNAMTTSDPQPDNSLKSSSASNPLSLCLGHIRDTLFSSLKNFSGKALCKNQSDEKMKALCSRMHDGLTNAFNSLNANARNAKAMPAGSTVVPVSADGATSQ